MTMPQAAAVSAPVRAVSNVDPFSMEFFADPYPHHESMRETGPVFWLEKYGIWGMARFQEVRDSLTDWQTFCSSAGVGISDFRKEKPWRPPSLILEADPPLHTKTRGILAKVLAPGAIRKLREAFEAEAERLVDELVQRREFDGLNDLAEAYPLKVFPDAVGLPPEDRQNLLIYGGMVFNCFGPRNELFENALKNAAPITSWIMSKCKRDAITPDGLGAQIFAAATAGEITEDEAGMLLRSFLSAGVDTTVNGIGNALFSFATNPDQWAVLRESPALARQAFDEVLRYESPVQTFFRTTTKSVVVSGTEIPEGEKVLLFLAAANRDPRQWENADKFDIQRKATGHVGFGTGIHGCVGQMIARMEAELVLAAMAKRIKSIELTGEPVRQFNNTLRGIDSLPIRVTPL